MCDFGKFALNYPLKFDFHIKKRLMATPEKKYRIRNVKIIAFIIKEKTVSDNSSQRRDLGYTIISRFEATLRNLISDKIKVLYGDFKEAIPDGILQKTINRAKTSEFETPLDFLEETDFSDLKDISTYRGLFRYYFDPHTLSQSEFTKMMDDLYKTRCKIAHIRGIFTPIDIDELFEYTREIANAMEENGTELLNFLENLENYPEKHIIPVPEDFICQPTMPYSSTIPNNLPTPDYELEGGFVGREEDIRKTKSLVEGELHRVVTITGAGGVGKTALALRVIQRILSDPNSNFDGIIWLSAKESKLSAFGIEEIEPTLKDYEELLDTILEVMGYGTFEQSIEQKEKDVKTILDFHKKILLVIDNLETITDERIINFILDAHSNAKILITSRRGLGQVERRYELNQLKEKEAITLFRQIAFEKNLTSLAKLDNDTIGTYVKKVACYPLAIKWVIGRVALGKEINSIVDAVVKEESDIALFCFDQIYNSLKDRSKKLLCTLSVFDLSPQAGVLQYVTNLTQEEFDESIRELVLVSLVIPEQSKTEENQIITRYTLLSLTRGFVRNQLDRDSKLKREIEERIRTVQTTVEEAERVKKQYKFSLFNLGATTEEEKIAALLAQTAYQKYQGGRYAEAVEDYKRASEIAPRFASIYRNWAVMESNEGHQIEADKLMKKAVELSPRDAQLWLTWGNMKRKVDKVKEALDLYLKAKDIAPNDYVILNALGQAKCRLGDYKAADQLFREALSNDSNSPIANSVKHEIINRTSLADNLRRWAESLSNDRNYTEAKNKLNEALTHCEKAFELDESDIRTKDLHRKLLFSLGYVFKKNDTKQAIEYFKKVIVPNPIRFYEARDTVRAVKEIIKLYLEDNNLEAALSLFSNKLAKIAKRTELKSYKEIISMINKLKREGTIEGKIITVNTYKGFCIIESINSPGDTYLGHINSFIPRTLELNDSLIGKHVTFFPEIESVKNKKQAKSIKIILQ